MMYWVPRGNIGKGNHCSINEWNGHILACQAYLAVLPKRPDPDPLPILESQPDLVMDPAFGLLQVSESQSVLGVNEDLDRLPLLEPQR